MQGGIIRSGPSRSVAAASETTQKVRLAKHLLSSPRDESRVSMTKLNSTGTSRDQAIRQVHDYLNARHFNIRHSTKPLHSPVALRQYLTAKVN
jgi:hypothetical protein